MSSYIHTLDYIFITQQGTLVHLGIVGRKKQLTNSNVTYSVIFCDMSINSILQGTIYYFWEFFFLIQSLLYIRQIQTIYLQKTAPTHE